MIPVTSLLFRITQISQGEICLTLVKLKNMSDASRYAAYALRRSYERLYEIAQHKGFSECLNRVTDILGDVDELCDIEKRREFGIKNLILR